MSLANTNLSAAVSALASGLPMKPSQRIKQKGAESQAAAANVAAAVEKSDNNANMLQEMILDIQSYRKELDQKLESLAKLLSDLDQGVERIDSLTIKNKQQDPEILTVCEQKDAFEQMFDELFRELNRYGAGRFVQAQSNVSAERALTLLESK